MNYARQSALVAAALLLAACGGAAVPQQQLTASEASIKAAEAVGADTEPKAALHLKQAREGVDKAKALIAEDENERAEYVLRRAEVDANLAQRLAQAASMKKEADRATEEVAALKKKLAEGGVK